MCWEPVLPVCHSPHHSLIYRHEDCSLLCLSVHAQPLFFNVSKKENVTFLFLFVSKPCPSPGHPETPTPTSVSAFRELSLMGEVRSL